METDQRHDNAVRPAREPHRPRTVGSVAAAALGLIVVVGLLAWAALSGAGPGAGPELKHFRGDGLGFDYPAEWRVHDASAGFSGGSVVAILGTVRVDPACGVLRVDINCFYRGELQPGSVALVVGTVAWMDRTFFDFEPSEGWALTAGGLPAALTVSGPNTADGSDLGMEWILPMPGMVTNGYTLRASLRGPGVAEMRAQLDALVASIRFDQPAPRLPSGPDAAEAAARAARVAIDTIDRDSREWYDSAFYGCFLREPGQTRETTIEDGPGGPLPGPLPVACATAVEPTELGLWQLTLTVAWAAGEGYPAGRYEETHWLLPAGTSAGRKPTLETVAWPVTKPIVTPAPLGTPLIIPPGSVVEVLVPGLTIWLRTEEGDSLDTMQPDDRVYVVSGPVPSGGRDWYRVEWRPGRSFVPLFGWAVVEAEGRPLVQVVEPACPRAGAAIDLATVVELLPAERLLCLGRRDLILGPVDVAEDEPDVEVDGDPAWLAGGSHWRLYGADDPAGVEGSLSVQLHPDAGPGLPEGVPLVVTGHFDDPAAAGCQRTLVGDDARSLSAESPEEQVLRCREQFVITAIHVEPPELLLGG